MFTFYIENYEPFGILTKNCLYLDKNKSTVSTFSVCVVYESAVSTIQKSNYVGCFNLRQWMFVFAHLFPDISIKSTNFYFQSWKKFSQTISLFFIKWLPRYQEITVLTALRLKIPFIYFRHIKVSWVKAFQISCLFIFISMYPQPEQQIWLEMYQMFYVFVLLYLFVRMRERNSR